MCQQRVIRVCERETRSDLRLIINIDDAVTFSASIDSLWGHNLEIWANLKD